MVPFLRPLQIDRIFFGIWTLYFVSRMVHLSRFFFSTLMPFRRSIKEDWSSLNLRPEASLTLECSHCRIFHEESESSENSFSSSLSCVTYHSIRGKWIIGILFSNFSSMTCHSACLRFLQSWLLTILCELQFSRKTEWWGFQQKSFVG